MNFKVIGVHKGFLKNKNLNIGSFIKVPIEQFKNLYSQNEENKKFLNKYFSSKLIFFLTIIVN